MIDRGRLGAILRSPARVSAELFGRRLHGIQVQIRKSVLKHRRTSVRGGTGWGKTYVAADVAADWLIRYWPDAAVIATATTWPQISGLFMGEVRSLVTSATGRTDLPKPSKMRWDLGPTCWLECISPNDEEGGGGRHRARTLVIKDEASGMKPERHKALEGSMSAGHAHLAEFGNPLNAEGDFVDHHTRERSIYNCFSVPVWITPNFKPLLDAAKDRFESPLSPDGRRFMLEMLLDTDDDVIASWVVHPNLTRPLWVKHDAYTMWGPGHPSWDARVESEFPRYSAHALIPLSWMEDLATLDPVDDGKAYVDIGIDVAGKGEDETVTTVWCPDTESILAQYFYPKADADERAVEDLLPWRNRIRNIRYDEIGVGQYFDRPLQREFGDDDRITITGINVGVASSMPTRFKNLRAEMHWTFRERCKERKVSGFRGEVLTSQAAPLWWDTDLMGRTFIAPKKDMPRSPDRLESILYAVGCPTICSTGADPDPFGSAVSGITGKSKYTVPVSGAGRLTDQFGRRLR